MDVKKYLVIGVLTFAVFSAKCQNTGDGAVYASTNESIASTSIEEIDQLNKIEVYPNPSVDYVVVRLENTELIDPKFQLHSVIGNTIDVESEKIGVGRYKIDLRSFSSGYYFLIVEDEATQLKEAIKFLKN